MAPKKTDTAAATVAKQTAKLEKANAEKKTAKKVTIKEPEVEESDNEEPKEKTTKKSASAKKVTIKEPEVEESDNEEPKEKTTKKSASAKKKSASAKKKSASAKKETDDETTDDEKTTKEEKPKRPPTEYQIFKKAKLEELRAEYDDEETRPGYKDLLKMVNEAWYELYPKKEAKAKKDPDQKRAPSAYNIFVKETMPQIKKENEGTGKKQTDYMAIIAKMWNEKKQATGIK
jgi:hypothetical protein